MPIAAVEDSGQKLHEGQSKLALACQLVNKCYVTHLHIGLNRSTLIFFYRFVTVFVNFE